MNNLFENGDSGRLFTDYDPPTAEQQAHIDIVRQAMANAELVVRAQCPVGPRRTIALRKIEEGMMFAAKAIILGS